ncbi:NAD(P)H-dependent oxidoreductase [Saccharopolyspora erythraea]|uniref:NADPH-dependent FMN reductase n=1 Tax=Saccharopolyspora erythraea TaxID=1836 RepID=UPI001BA60A63|nr:NAD(P)H-dependent oxidoreductase [Saccharopolyspora erythraea]QUH02629.1 NAD(P)H-dependent oxidoreductase [Saccharopolyspora erythraea]
MSSAVIVSSSPAAGSRLEAVTGTLHRCLLTSGHPAEVLNLRDLPQSALLTASCDHPAIRRSRRLVSTADVLAFVVPCYQPGGSPVLREWLGLLPDHAFSRATVQLVGVGAVRGHAVGLEHIRTRMLVEQSARDALPVCFLYDHWIDGREELASSAAESLASSVRALGDVLAQPTSLAAPA